MICIVRVNMNNKELLIATSYLPSVYYVNSIINTDSLQIEAMENYPKQTLRNRCFICAANGVLCLTIPVQKKNTPLQLTKDMCINDSYNWQKIHWTSIISAYKSAPFFQFYDYLFEPFYNKKYKFLLDFNNEILDVILNKILKQNIRIKMTEVYENNVGDKDLRYLCNVKTYENQKLYNYEAEYYQVFAAKNGFIKNTSIIDLIFNEGNCALEFLKTSVK